MRHTLMRDEDAEAEAANAIDLQGLVHDEKYPNREGQAENTTSQGDIRVRDEKVKNARADILSLQNLR